MIPDPTGAAPTGSSSWLMRVLIALDRLANAILRGKDRETISSRAGRARDEGKRWGCILCRLLDWIEAGHCDKSAGV